MAQREESRRSAPDAFSCTLAPTRAAPAIARRFVADALAAWNLSNLHEVAVLLTSELVTNAILHAGTDVAIEVTRVPTGVRVDVADGSSHLPVSRWPRPSDGNGRGMALVETLATRWGAHPEPSGKRVWFEVDAAR